MQMILSFDYWADQSAFVVSMSFEKEMLTLTTLNALIGHHLEFTEANWSAQWSHGKIICIFYKKNEYMSRNNHHGWQFLKYHHYVLAILKKNASYNAVAEAEFTKLTQSVQVLKETSVISNQIKLTMIRFTLI